MAGQLVTSADVKPPATNAFIAAIKPESKLSKAPIEANEQIKTVTAVRVRIMDILGLGEGVCKRWVHDPYFQFLTGDELFKHTFPHERSDLGHWRKRLGDRLGLLLAESLRVAHEAGALRGQDLKRVTVGTTVQPKAITFPTDAKLLHTAIRGSSVSRSGTASGCGDPSLARPRPPR